MRVDTFAAAMPTVTSVIGDRAGFHLGQTSGASRRAASWHPWAAMEQRERSGACVVAAVPGGGKSALLGALAYWSVMAGVRTLILDPSGPLARLCGIPELAGVAQATDLMNAAPGALQPYAMIGDPRPEHHLADRPDDMTDDEWQAECKVMYLRAVEATQAQRQTLCLDTLNALLPYYLTQDAAAQGALRDAVLDVPGLRTSNPNMVLRKLAAGDVTAQSVGKVLAQLSKHPQVRLIFPDGTGTPDVLRDDLLLQVLTMRGVVLPSQGKPRAEWSTAETIGVPLLNLAAHLAAQYVYAKPLHERALFEMDDAWALMLIAAGRALVGTLARDSRKLDLRSVFSSQDVVDILANADIDNHLDCSFIGRTEGLAAQEAACRVQRVPLGVGYEAVYGTLSPRERGTTDHIGARQFVWNDGDGGIEKVTIHVPDAVLSAVNTTADPAQARPRLRAVSA